VTKTIDRKILREIPKVLASLGMFITSYKPQEVGIGFLYNVILDGRIIGYIPETITEWFIKNLRILKVQGNQVNIQFIFTYIHMHIVLIYSYQNFVL